ncbi:sensor histidine kinase [Dactylosporangium sp. NPDC051541]|uniref:sensor histidine kinase n=1 Tax=Dactylosporangium sp. NPDC051541 TaxID=3363977 RepID=UPI0037B0237A
MTRGLPGWLRTALFDIAPVLVALAIGVSLTSGPAPVLRPWHGLTTAVLAGSAVLLWWRRRAPVATVWVAAGLSVAVAVVDRLAPDALVPVGVEANWLPWWPPTAPFAVYTALASAGGRRGGSLAVALLIGAVLAGPWAGMPGAGEVVGRTFAFVVGAALLGLYAGARRRLVQALVDRAERAEREQHLVAQRARVEERVRLAAEMHDVVTHRVSLMVVQAGGLVVSTRDEAVRGAAEELRVTGCQALAELRDLVGILRETAPDGAVDHAPTGVGPGVAAQPPAPPIAPLVAESRVAGIDVELTEEGDRELASPVVGRTLHRIVQESLTNARKHAPGAPVRVRLRYRPDGVRVSVRNGAPTGPVDELLVAAGSGTGLYGLRQRVELVNGTLTAGPDTDGGFLVTARLPAFVPTHAAVEPAP